MMVKKIEEALGVLDVPNEYAGQDHIRTMALILESMTAKGPGGCYFSSLMRDLREEKRILYEIGEVEEEKLTTYELGYINFILRCLQQKQLIKVDEHRVMFTI